MTTKENSIVNSKLLEKFTLEYLKEHEELINFVKKETEKQLRIGSVSGSCPQEVAENIVTELDAFGRKINSVEYGLPIVDWDEKYEKCLQIVKDNYR